MDGAVVGGDDEVAIGPLRLFVSADEQFEGEAFENEIVSADSRTRFMRNNHAE